MVVENAESQTPRERTNQEECRASSNRRCLDRTGCNSQSVWGESLTFSRDDWAQTDSCNTGGITLGGTLEQLINDTHAELRELDNRSEKLHKRLSELVELLNSLQKTEIP
ncbi:hypothetical protein [Trichormus variabilis]|uniref:Uncharacterized protein n=1 Tax=Trichormus variabilis SAG 1403-4b TaxID=447716 RepID=A0A3S1I8S8_ANAVA|nr:hypothetical protein [Trichormus variabilis]MBD2628835.1 hypothetical protein [Trichormus variabilis FACHB-164]RUS93759.1 hypothetical protein DSM107003_42600 [Trichormus variabilis SAG 1403-4b]